MSLGCYVDKKKAASAYDRARIFQVGIQPLAYRMYAMSQLCDGRMGLASSTTMCGLQELDPVNFPNFPHNTAKIRQHADFDEFVEQTRRDAGQVAKARQYSRCGWVFFLHWSAVFQLHCKHVLACCCHCISQLLDLKVCILSVQ